MKSLKMVAIVLIVALVAACTVACTPKQITNDLQSVFNTWLDETNGLGATEVHLDMDSINVVALDYITFQSSEGLDISYYDITATVTRDGTVLFEKHYYYSVVHKEGTLTVHTANADAYEKYTRDKSAKEGKIKPNKLKGYVAAAKEYVTSAVAQRKAKAEEEAREAQELQGAEDALTAVVDAITARTTALIGAGTVTKDTTPAQMRDALATALPQYVFEALTEEDDPLETAADTYYVHVGDTQAYTLYAAEFTVYTDRYSLSFTIGTDGSRNTISSAVYR